MEISTITPPTGTPSASESEKAAISSDFETFIKMLTAQMENQDPLNPLDSQDFATQLATFSGVEQQVKTNDLLAALGSQMQLSGLGEMAGWVGMEARIGAPAHFDGSPIEVIPNPPAFSDSAELVVYDQNDLEVDRLPIPVSDEAVFWMGAAQDGSPLEIGTYSFSVEAKSNGKVIDAHTPDVFAEIHEVRLVDGSAVIVLEGGAIHTASAVSGLR
jgi:flagellar basal-body rod modification protein FlgD